MNPNASTPTDSRAHSIPKFDFSISWRKLLLFGFAFGLLTLSPYSVAACFVALSVYSLCGRRQALEAMALSVVAKYANPALVAFPEYFGLYAWAFLFISSLSLFARSKFKNCPVILPLVIFYVTILCISFWSRYPAISMLKATSFFVVVAAILSGSFSMTREECVSLAKTLFNLFFIVLLLSIPTYMHSIGFLRNGRGFQGVLSHPQAFGIFWVPVCSWVTICLYFKHNLKSSYKLIFLFILTIMMMILSQSRTSIVATGLALILTLPALLGFQARNFGAALKKGMTLSFLSLCLLLVAVGMSDRVSGALIGFVTKGEVQRSVEDAFEASRGKGVENHLQNFMKSPWVGNGFGVDSHADFGSRVQYLMGIPVSAASEKGIVYTAVLEEIGIIGLMPFLIFLGVLISRGIKNDFPFMAMFFGCLMVNIGEAVFFSVNGNGLYYWVLVGLCMSCSVHKIDATGSSDQQLTQL